MNAEQETQNSRNVKTIIKHQAETKRLKNGSQRRRGRSLPHFPQFTYSQSKVKHRVSLLNSKREKDVPPQNSSRINSIIDELINHVSSSKIFTSQSKIQILDQLKLLSKSCKLYSKKSSPSSKSELTKQWNDMKNMMYSDLEGKIQRNRSKCLSLFEQLTSSLENTIQNNEEEEEKNENVSLLEQINHIQKNLETVSDQINAFQKIQDNLVQKSYPDSKLIDLLKTTIQILVSFRESFTQKYGLVDQIERYENELKEIFSPESNEEISNENNEADNASSKSVPVYNKSNQSNSTNITNQNQKQQKHVQPRKASLMTPKENEEYKALITQNREIKINLKRSLDNKRILEKKKKEIEELYQDEIEKNHKTIKSLQKKKQAADSALQDLQRITNDIQNLRDNLKQLQSRAIPLRHSVDQLDNEGTRKVKEQLDTILNENTTMENEIKNLRTNILTNEEKLYVKQSIEKEKKDQQNQFYSIPSLIYSKQNDIAIMRSSDRYASSLPVDIDDPENIYIQYDRLKSMRHEQLESLSKEKMKMKKQILSSESKLQKNVEDAHNILLQIRQYSNIDKESKEAQILSIFQKTQNDINKLRTKAKSEVITKSNEVNSDNDAAIQEIRKEEAKEEVSVMKSEIKSANHLFKEFVKQTNESREKSKEPKVDALMNSCMEYLIQKRIATNDENEFNLDSEINQLISQTESYNKKLSATINKATEHLNELANRMLGTNQQNVNQNPIQTLKTLGGILRQNEIQKQKDIRQIGVLSPDH